MFYMMILYTSLTTNEKEYIIGHMITEKQKRAANNIMAQKLVNKENRGKALRNAGYSNSVSKTPQLVTKSKGFLAYMNNSGLTDENLAIYLAADIEKKPGNRLGELKLAMEVKGLNDKNINVNMERADETLALMKEIIDGEEKV